MNWTPFNEPVALRVLTEPIEAHHPGPHFITIEALAWRWNDDKKNVEYLGVSGMIWTGKSGRRIGVTSLDRKASK